MGRSQSVIEIPLRDRAGNLRAVALIDDEDAPLAEYRWSLNQGYATRQAEVDGKRTTISLHRAVADRMGIGDAPVIDHISRDRLDDRRVNLRRSTPLLNARNRAKKFSGRHVLSEEDRRKAAERQRRYRERNKAKLRQDRVTGAARDDARAVLRISKTPVCGCCDVNQIDFLTVVEDEILCRNCAHARRAGALCPHQAISRRLG